jgi:hypothetical protein
MDGKGEGTVGTKAGNRTLDWPSVHEYSKIQGVGELCILYEPRPEVRERNFKMQTNRG